MRSGVEDARFPGLPGGAGRRRSDARQPLRRPHQRRSDLPGDAEGDRRRAEADQLRDLHLRHRHRRRPVHRGAGARGAARRARPADGRRRRRELDGEGPPRSAEGGRLRRSCSSTRRAGTRSRKSTTGRIARSSSSTAAIGFTGGVGVADHWLGHAQDAEHWRDTQVRMTGPIARLLEARLLRELHRGRHAGRAGARRPGAARRRRGRVDPRAQLAVRRQQRSEAAVPAAHGRRATDARHHHAVLRDRRVHDVGARGRRAPRREDPPPGRGRQDRRDAGEVRLPPGRTTTCSTRGIEIYEYQPTMMHAKAMVVDGVISMFGSANFDNRSLELNDELNVAVANRDLAARLTEDLRAGSPARQAARPRRVAPPLAARKDPRVLLELLRGDLLDRRDRARIQRLRCAESRNDQSPSSDHGWLPMLSDPPRTS